LNSVRCSQKFRIYTKERVTFLSTGGEIGDSQNCELTTINNIDFTV
jgi:hypothetical protein